MPDLNLERFNQFIIHPESVDSAVAKRVLSLVPNYRIIVGTPTTGLHGTLSAKEFEQSKKSVFITPFRGQFFKRCPGAKPNLTCCNYFVLNLGVQCDMNCSYCYLQSFINYPYLTIYSNINDALVELRTLANTYSHLPYRVGTGETIDSLSLDDLTLYSRELIAFFRNYPKWRLEFKTKSSKVDQFLDTPHAGNVIVSWSINPEEVIAAEEHGTASLSARLAAARLCLNKGLLVAFHIDPMILHSGWQVNYTKFIKKITDMFAPNEITYFSLGALRFQPEQRHMMRERFGFKSMVVRAEMWTGPDGKLRYDQRLREEMFSLVRNEFYKNSPNWNIFLCMENLESWLSTFQQKPLQMSNMQDLFRPLKEPRDEAKRLS